MTSNLPANRQDVWIKATEMDKTAALASLASLPSRATSSAELSKAGYYVALENVTRYGLSEAVKAILKGSLKHAFFPSPPELRLQCDKAMEWHENMDMRIRRQERENEEFNRLHGKPWEPDGPEQKARAARLYADFCKGYEQAVTEETFTLDPDLVAKIPDNPKALVHQRQGNK